MQQNNLYRVVLWLVAIVAVLITIFLINKPVEEVPTEIIEKQPVMDTIGQSIENRPIEAYSFGDGPDNILFVGGIHGGYEWNSTLLAYKMIEHFYENTEAIPESITITIVPSANPDGLFAVTGKTGEFDQEDVKKDLELGTGRFNAAGVDLNRNFDCKWQEESTWRGNKVSAGTEPFSEPESRALRDHISTTNPLAVIFWHSQANAVYASECEDGILSDTLAIMRSYAESADYKAIDSFDAYPITGDAEGWLASINIPSISVELSTHEDLDWERNLAGVRAIIDYYNDR